MSIFRVTGLSALLEPTPTSRAATEFARLERAALATSGRDRRSLLALAGLDALDPRVSIFRVTRLSALLEPTPTSRAATEFARLERAALATSGGDRRRLLALAGLDAPH